MLQPHGINSQKAEEHQRNTAPFLQDGDHGRRFPEEEEQLTLRPICEEDPDGWNIQIREKAGQQYPLKTPPPALRKICQEADEENNGQGKLVQAGQTDSMKVQNTRKHQTIQKSI